MGCGSSCSNHLQTLLDLCTDLNDDDGDNENREHFQPLSIHALRGLRGLSHLGSTMTIPTVLHYMK